MRVRALVAVLLISGIAGCAPDKKAAGTGATPEGSASAAGSGGFSMWGSMRLAFFDDSLGSTDPKPSFEVTSPECRLLGENVWEIQNAQAVIYGRDSGEYRIKAGTARFDGVTKSAVLGGGVLLDAGDQRIEMEDVTWVNGERVAKTERPVTITSAGTTMHAEGMQFRPDPGTDPEQYIQLYKVNGSFDLTTKGQP